MPKFVGLQRLGACWAFICRELCGPTGALALVAILGVGILGAALPHGALQTSAEQDDLLAPLRMALLSVPIYATPMQTISQLGMMFAHGNSPGAAFCLLLLGTGVNLGTLWWLTQNYGWRSTSIWFASLFVVVVTSAYVINKPLIPPGVEPAGHTHAFDVYSNPFGGTATLTAIQDVLLDSVGWAERVTLVMMCLLTLIGWFTPEPQESNVDIVVKPRTGKGLDRDVPPAVVGLTGLVGLLAASIVGCLCLLSLCPRNARRDAASSHRNTYRSDQRQRRGSSALAGSLGAVVKTLGSGLVHPQLRTATLPADADLHLAQKAGVVRARVRARGTG